ncbi:hypothetical protein Vretimale_97, partial [Volvox reticuliferus]
MGVPVVPAILEAPPSLQEQAEPSALTADTATGVAATLDETLQHVESVGRPHDWWWALNNWRKCRVLAVFGKDISVRLEAILASKYWLLITMTLTLFCLYAVDVCDVAKGGINAGTVVSAILLAIFVIFSLDLLLSSIFVDKYILSFFFWVDLLGTASLILDIKWFLSGILSSEDSNALQITRAGRSARIGSQMGRITRVLRLLRALKLLKVLQLRRRSHQGMDPLGLGNGPIRPTVLGELLAESTTRKCVIVILFVLVVATFLQTYPPTAADYSRIQLVSYGVMTPEAFVQSAPHPVILMTYVDAHDGGRQVSYLSYTRTNMRSIMQLRTRVECAKFLGSQVEACGFLDDFSTIWYDVSKTQQLNAGLNIVLTSVIIACLGLSAYFFGRDATTYVIMPIETMLKYLKRMIMVGVDGDVESENMNIHKPPETDVLANYVSRLVNEIDNARWKAEEEARISDTLLNSMVPPRIARQLKELRWWEAGPEQRAQTIADSFPHATVLFTDIVGFTVLSSRISAEDAMRHLNNMYTIFDEIVEKYSLYKVETIGDSYMLVGGAPEERQDHAERVAAAALEIRACVPLLQQISGEPGINVRIGMHSGAVTAGVVGFKNPRWHLFGDTCNTASRMESTGIAGEIQLSCTTYELIKDRFQCKVRGKIAVKGKGEMVTYLLEREYGPDNPPDSPSVVLATSGATAVGPVAGAGGAGGDAEAFLTSPQFKKAMERYTTARNSLLTEEEELCKLLKPLDEATATAAAFAAGAGPAPPPIPPSHEAASATPSAATTTAAAAAAGVLVPRLAVGLPNAAFKQLVLGACTPSDLKALSLHMHEELRMARAMMASAEEEKAVGMRRDMLLKLFARVLEAPGMSLRDTFAAILDTLYKVIECDVIKMYVVDHARGQLWPATRHSAADRTLPLEGTLAGSAVQRARVIRVDDVACDRDFNPELEELPAGYTSKSMMCVPVFSVTNYHAPGLHHHARLFGAGGSTTHGSVTSPSQTTMAAAGQAGPGPGDVIAVLVMVNRWTPWREAGAEEGERRIVPFASDDEASMRDASSSVGLLLMRRRGEMLLASAVPPSCLAGASFSVAALPASVARQRLRTVARRSSVALLDARGNLWAMKQEGLMGQARDVLSALQRRVPSSALSVLGAVSEDILYSYLVRISDEQCAGRFFNLAHSVGVLQGIYLTLRTNKELATALGPLHLLALVLAASLLNVDREGELLPAVPMAGNALSIGAGTVVSGGAVGRSSRARGIGGSAGVAAAAAAGMLDMSSSQSRGTPPLPPIAPQLLQPQPPAQSGSSAFQNGLITAASSWRNSEPGIVGNEGAVPAEQRATPARADYGIVPLAAAVATAAAAPPGPSGTPPKLWSGRFPSGSLSLSPTAAAAAALEVEATATAAAPLAAVDSGVVPDTKIMSGDGPSPLIATKGPGSRAAAAISGATTKASVPMLTNSQPSRPGLTVSIPPQPSTSMSGMATQTDTTSVGMLSGGGDSAGIGSGGGGNTPGVSSAAFYISRNRAVNIWRGRLAALVDDILSGESNILAALPVAEAATVKSYVVTLLALRNQHAAVLSMPGLQPCRRNAVAASGGGASVGLASAAAGTVSDSLYGPPSSVAAALEALVATGNDTSTTPRMPTSPLDNGASGALSPPIGQAAQGQEKPAEAPPDGPEVAPAAATVIGATETEVSTNLMSNGGGGGSGGATSTPAAGDNLLNGPVGLTALMQAAGSDPNRLAETRTAICALLLLTWSELIHSKDPATALSLLQCRATDVRTWASRLAANMSGRRRTVSLLGANDYGVDDVQNLLLLEVPRMQLEVIPLWQRTVELLPGLQPQLDALQANRATYMSMLQDTGSLAATSSYGGIGATAAATATASVQRSSAGSAATSRVSGPVPGFFKSSGRRKSTMLDSATSSREPPRRFISVKHHGAFARSILTVVPSDDSGSSATAAGSGGGGGANAGTRGRLFVRASSSRSYNGRNGADDFEPDVMGPGGGSSAAAAIVNSASGKLLQQGEFANKKATDSRSLRRATSRSGGPPPTQSSRLASLALPPYGHSPSFVSAAAAAAGMPANRIDNTGAATVGQNTRVSNHSFARQVSAQVLGFRPRSQTRDNSTAPLAEAGTAATTSPIDASGDQRRTSIASRLNSLFVSFRVSGRSSQRPLVPATDAAGGSSHTNAAAASPVTGGLGSPRPPPSQLSGSSPFEVYSYAYSARDGGSGGGLASQGSQQLSLNLATAVSAAAPTSVGTAATGSAPFSPALSQALRGTTGGWGEGCFISSGSASPVRLAQTSQSRAALPVITGVTGSRRPTAPANLAIALDCSEPLRIPPGEGPAAAAATPTVLSSERGAFGFPGGKLRASIMRRLSYVAAKLPFHDHTAVAAASNAAGSGRGNGATAGGTGWAGAADAAAAVPTEAAAMPSASVGLPPGTDAAVALTLSGSTSSVLPLTNAGYGGRRRDSRGDPGQNFHSVPLPAALQKASLLRSGTIQPDGRAQRQSQPQLQLHESRRSHPQLFGERPPPQPLPPPPLARPRRTTAPSGALALAQQHEQYAATVAAAAVAFAARQAAANQADAASDGADGDVEDGMPFRNTGSALSLTGGLMAGLLPTVAELTGSGQNSSATGTARSNSTAAPGTPKHVAMSHPQTLSGVTAGAATSGGGGIATAAGPPSRFAPVHAYEMALVGESGSEPALPPPASQPPSSAYGPMVAASAVTAQGRGGDSSSAADYGDPRATGPSHRASSKGVWLGLRLATDALRSVGRRADCGGYSASSSGVLAMEPGMSSQQDTEMPRMPSAFPNSSAPHRTSLRLGPASAASRQVS